PLIGGQLLPAIIGIACAQAIPSPALASACAVGGSIFAMLLLRCPHPPGAATAIAVTMGGDSINALGYNFLLIPLGLNVAILLIMSIVINRWMLGYQYPMIPKPILKETTQGTALAPSQLTGISEQDLEQALKNLDMFMDVAPGDLSKLLTDAQKHSFKRLRGNITCAEIMVKNVLFVEYGTEVEDAWNIMHSEKLKAMPVINKARRVIGIITWNDFFKFISLNTDKSFQEKLRDFIRRTPDVTTDKPESVGHIMAASVAVLHESAHIAELIPLMTNQGYRQIPIVNSEDRLVGMVYQANLIAELYNEQLAIYN
ncbi:MAG: HPP family protein, partial [Methylobacter sp.]|nr:HPP family protein [Methylobacter sp.]